MNQNSTSRFHQTFGRHRALGSPGTGSGRPTGRPRPGLDLPGYFSFMQVSTSEHRPATEIEVRGWHIPLEALHIEVDEDDFDAQARQINATRRVELLAAGWIVWAIPASSLDYIGDLLSTRIERLREHGRERVRRHGVPGEPEIPEGDEIYLVDSYRIKQLEDLGELDDEW